MKSALSSSAKQTGVGAGVAGASWRFLESDWSLPSGESLTAFALERGFLASSLLTAAVSVEQQPSAEGDRQEGGR